MLSNRFQADAAGVIRSGIAAHGFALFPLPPGSTERASIGRPRPGSYPVTVTLKTPGKGMSEIIVAGPQSFLMAAPFSTLDVSGCNSGDVWQIIAFDKGEGLGAPSRSRNLVTLTGSATYALTTGAGAQAIPIRPEDIEQQIYLSTDADTEVSIIVLPAVGNTFYTLETVSVPAGTAVLQRRLPGRTFSVNKSNSANVLMVVDVLTEVG